MGILTLVRQSAPFAEKEAIKDSTSPACNGSESYTASPPQIKTGLGAIVPA
jgi:hypothetical protein